ncbi:MAG: hypothetical protein ACPG06_10020 [Alphaproteobacteria bacterium]
MMDLIQNFFEQSGSDLVAVILGGVLATAGGFLGTIYEERRDQARQGVHLRSVLLDALRTIHTIYHNVLANEQFFYDPGWYRAMRSLRNEFEVFERNREQMVYLDDNDLRTAISSFMIRLVLHVDGFNDDQNILDALDNARDIAERANDTAALTSISAPIATGC